MINEKEFTELQGLMGADYALKTGEKETVSLGIQEHYYPKIQRGPNAYRNRRNCCWTC